MSRQNQNSKRNNETSFREIWTVPEGTPELTESEVRALPQADQIRKIILPDSVRRIDNYCFSSLHKLEEVRFPDSADAVGIGIFRHCWNLRRVILPEGTRRIDAAFFYGCGRLCALKIPKTVDEIDRDALRTCEQLTDVELADEKFSRYPRTVRLLAALTCIRKEKVQISGSDSAPYPQTAAYISSHRLSLMDIAIAENDTDAVYQMLQHPLFSDALNRVELQRLADRTNREGRTEIMVMLLKELQKKDAEMEEESFEW